MKRVLVLSVCALALGVWEASAASAALYPPGQPTGAVSDTTVTPGQSIIVSGSNWCPGSTVQLTLQPGNISLGSATAGAKGSFSQSVTIPRGLQPGTFHIVLTGLAADCSTRTSVSITIQVLAAPSAAFTGARLTVGLLMLLALGILGMGSILLSRRRAALR